MPHELTISNASLTSHVVAYEPGAHAVAAHWLGEVAALALADGQVALLRDGEATLVAPTRGGVLVAAGEKGGW